MAPRRGTALHISFSGCLGPSLAANPRAITQGRITGQLIKEQHLQHSRRPVASRAVPHDSGPAVICSASRHDEGSTLEQLPRFQGLVSLASPSHRWRLYVLSALWLQCWGGRGLPPQPLDLAVEAQQRPGQLQVLRSHLQLRVKGDRLTRRPLQQHSAADDAEHRKSGNADP